MLSTPINSGFDTASPYLDRPRRSEVQARIDMGLCPFGAKYVAPEIGPNDPCPVCGATEADAGKPGWTCSGSPARNRTPLQQDYGAKAGRLRALATTRMNEASAATRKGATKAAEDLLADADAMQAGADALMMRGRKC